MIARFLRLFKEFRDIEAYCGTCNDLAVKSGAEAIQLREALQEQNTQNLLLQDRLDAAMDDRAKLWGMMERAIENERATLQMQCNFTVQQKFGITPFPDAPHLPPSAEPSAENAAPFARRMMPSELVAHRIAQFAKTHAQRHQKPA